MFYRMSLRARVYPEITPPIPTKFEAKIYADALYTSPFCVNFNTSIE